MWCQCHIPAPHWQCKATGDQLYLSATSTKHSPSTYQKSLKNISQPFGNAQAVTKKNRKVTNLMKNEAAAEAPAETPAGATKLWEAAEPPGPVGSELFCPELTWTLGPSQTLSGAVSAWKRNKRKYIGYYSCWMAMTGNSDMQYFQILWAWTEMSWGAIQLDKRTNRRLLVPWLQQTSRKTQGPFVTGNAQLNSLTGMKKWKTISRTLLF